MLFRKYQAGPLKEKSKCFVLSILLWEHLPAGNMDENVPGCLSSALQNPLATPYGLCKLKNSWLAMSYIQDQNVESQLHSVNTPSIMTATQLRIWTGKGPKMTAMSQERKDQKKDIWPSVVRKGQSYPALKEASQSSGVVTTSRCVQQGRCSQRTSLNAVKIIMGYYFDEFRHAHGCMPSLCGNNEYGIWPRFAKRSLDPHGI